MSEQASTPDQIERRTVVRIGKRLARLFSFHYHNLTVLSPCQIPATGGAILVSNHTSSIDPMFLQAGCPRLITWMMAREYYGSAATRWFFDAIEIILVERSGRDLAATRAALRALEAGKILGMFPEGRIEKSRELLDFQTGVALLAQKSGAPVYPAFLDGTQRRKGMLEATLMPNRSTVSYGPAVDLDYNASGREALEEATRGIREAVAALGKSCGQPASSVAAF